MTIDDFAGKLGLSVRTVAYWRQRPEMIQRPEGQRILDTVLEQAPDDVKARFVALVDKSRSLAVQDVSNSTSLNFGENASVSDASDVLAWIESTNTSDEFITYF